jgi:hypothetical protein
MIVQGELERCANVDQRQISVVNIAHDASTASLAFLQGQETISLVF